MSQRRFTSNATIDATAARWLLRRDRGLTPAEQDEFLEWRQADPRHAAAFARHEAAFRLMLGLGDWKPTLADAPNPDLFAPRRPVSAFRRHSVWLGAVAAALAFVAGSFFWRGILPDHERPTPSPTYLRVNERQALADGSIVELKDGSRIDVAYTATERRVKLVEGEAHFTVAKNPQRPFVVEARGVAVRAVGTAFNVRLDVATVEVLVTEGSVRVAPGDGDTIPAAAQQGVSAAGSTSTPAAAATLDAGERVVVDLGVPATAPTVQPITPAQIATALGWQKPRLQFHETPLAEAIAEFNRHATGPTPRRLVLGDSALGALTIGGTFRVDNLDGFVRLLEFTLEIRATERAAGELVLTRGH